MNVIWILLLLVIIYFSRHNLWLLVAFILNVFFNKYNDSYPVYSRFEIGESKYQAIRLNWQWDKNIEKQDKYRNKEGKGRKDFKNKDFSNEAKELIKDAWVDYYKSRWMQDKSEFMIESNVAVAAGKKTIEQVKSDFEKKFSGHGYYEKGIEHYKSWENVDNK